MRMSVHITGEKKDNNYVFKSPWFLILVLFRIV